MSSLDLSSSRIFGPIFGNFSRLTRLNRLDVSANSIIGELPDDLNRCVGLKHLNLSHNLIGGALNVYCRDNFTVGPLTFAEFQTGPLTKKWVIWVLNLIKWSHLGPEAAT